jgi:hypothetical protein
MTLELHAPQLILLAIVFFDLGANVILHGKPRENHHFGYVLISHIIPLILLYWGGFFG